MGKKPTSCLKKVP
jgi:hypothetical protein